MTNTEELRATWLALADARIARAAAELAAAINDFDAARRTCALSGGSPTVELSRQANESLAQSAAALAVLFCATADFPTPTGAPTDE